MFPNHPVIPSRPALPSLQPHLQAQVAGRRGADALQLARRRRALLPGGPAEGCVPEASAHESQAASPARPPDPSVPWTSHLLPIPPAPPFAAPRVSGGCGAGRASHHALLLFLQARGQCCLPGRAMGCRPAASCAAALPEPSLSHALPCPPSAPAARRLPPRCTTCAAWQSTPRASRLQVSPQAGSAVLPCPAPLHCWPRWAASAEPACVYAPLPRYRCSREARPACARAAPVAAPVPTHPRWAALSVPSAPSVTLCHRVTGRLL